MPGSLAAARQKLHRPLTRREETLDEMMDHFVDLQEVCFGRDSVGAGDGGTIRMPDAWNNSYRELDRCVVRMKNLAASDSSPGFRKMYLNLRGWYLTPTVRFRYRRVKKVHGRVLEFYELSGESRDRVRVVTPNGLASVVLVALEWVAAEFVGEPYRPTCRDCKRAGRGVHAVWACECTGGKLAA